MINRDNYETWIIDFLDGKLTTEQVGQLVLFLEMNPDIAEEFDGLDEVKLEDSNPAFSGKESLLKESMDLPMEDVDMLLAKKLEGDLSIEDEKAVDAMIASHEWIGRSWAILQKTQVVQASVKFANKESLLFPDQVDLSNEEMALIAISEGDLKQTELHNVDDIQKRIDIYSSLRVKVDDSIFYAGKAALLKKGGVVTMLPWLIRGVAAAAVVALLWQAWTITSSSDGATISGFSNVVDVKGVKDFETAQDKNSSSDYHGQSLKTSVQHAAQSTEKPLKSSLVFKIIEAPVSLASLKAGPLNYPNPKGILSIVESPVIEPVLFAELHDATIVPAENEVPTAVQFIGTKIKQKLWGEGNVPENNFALALAGKAVETYSNRTGVDLALAPPEDEKEGFSLRLGKLEISRY